MGKYKLGDIAPIKQGTIAKSEQYWLLNLDMVESNTGSIIEYLYVPSEEIGASTIVFDTNNVLYSKLRPYLNKVVIPDRSGYATSEMLPLKPNTNIITREYLTYFLRSPHFVSYINEKTSGAKMPRANSSDLKAVEIECPSIEEQRNITETFNHIVSVINKRKTELQLLDDLVKARFVEMFGDPTVNPKGYPIVPISELFDVGSSKRVFESEWRSEGVPFYRAREIVKLSKNGFVDNDLFIEEELYEQYTAKYGVPKAGDMMVTGVGTLGICYIVQPNDRFYFKDGNTLWFKNKGLCSVRFIMEQYNTDFVRNQIEATANVSTVGTYTITNANNTMILLPSIEEQEAFDLFVTQVDKSKYAVQKALDKTQMLFDSLMQEYFG